MKGTWTLAALAVLVAPAARAQLTTQIMLNQTTPIYGDETYPGGFHKEGCDQDTGQFQLSWSNSAAGSVSTGVGLGNASTVGLPTFQAFVCGTQPAATDSSCVVSGSDAGTGLLNVTNGVGVSYLNVDPRSMIGQAIGETNPCDATPASSGSLYICVAETQTNLYYGTGGSTTSNQCLIFPYDMNPPAAPTGVTVSYGDAVTRLHRRALNA